MPKHLVKDEAVNATKAGEEIVHRVEFPDGSEPLSLNRREFFRMAGVASAAMALASAGCQMPVEPIVPYVDRPEEQRKIGKPMVYSTTLGGFPVLVRTREGRPILVEANPSHPRIKTPDLRAQAAILDLYDPDRAQGPLSVRRSKGLPKPVDWETVTKKVTAALKESRGKIALLVGQDGGPASVSVLQEFSQAFEARVFHVSMLEEDHEARAWTKCFGEVPKPLPRFDKAELIVGFGAEFLDYPVSGMNEDYADSRDPDRKKERMGRFVAFEGRLSLTGANADERIRLRPSHLPAAAMALVHELVAKRRIGPAAKLQGVQSVLEPFSAESIAKVIGVDAKIFSRLADELADHQGKSLVICGATATASEQGETLETAVNLLNFTLGNFSKTFDPRYGKSLRSGGVKRLETLTDELNAGRIDLLLIAGANSVFDAPASLKFAEAMKKAKLVVSLADRVDETARQADYLAALSHPLESWGDAGLDRGLYGVVQPSIRPLYKTYGMLDLLISWSALAGEKGRLGAAYRAALDTEGNKALVHSPAYHYVKSYWIEHFFRMRPESEQAWQDVLKKGWIDLGGRRSPLAGFNPAAFKVFKSFRISSKDGLELEFFPSHALYDGSQGNNGWLLEFPDPISRVAWGEWLALAPSRFDEMGLQNGDLVEIGFNGNTLKIPAFRQAGMHRDVLAVPLGWGRTHVGDIGSDVGRNLFQSLAISEDSLVRSGIPVTVKKAKGNEPLAICQGGDVLDRVRRPLVPAATLAEYLADPKAGTGQIPGGESIWPEHDYKDIRWGMSIDLSRCTGCGNCVIACQAENNIPVVGKKGVLDGREMSWMRIDRYYDAPEKKGGWDDSVFDAPQEVVEEPKTLFQPMLCQHCENAPCETVCPFVATMHSADGLNQQIYNRCVGTRYCANNCPFKVRRFNWFDYQKPRPNLLFKVLVPEIKRHATLNVRGKMQMKNNPEVTVRYRGVMEKCSFCVQRIMDAREKARREGRTGKLRDGDVVTACQAACPSKAIVFGNVLDSDAKVSRTSRSSRAMKILEITNVIPSIAYLTKVRNEK